jgi:hypothetical protein
MKAGGTDYAGCAGSGRVVHLDRRATYDLTVDDLQALNATVNPFPVYQINQYRGIFGVNSATNMSTITDGTTQTIIVAEAERFIGLRAEQLNGFPERIPSDGWAWGGPATMLSTWAAPNKKDHFENAGGPHDGVVMIGLADGSARPVSESIGLNVWRRLGSMSDGVPVGNGF